MVATGQVLLGLGGNYPGPWGNPTQTMARALRELGRDRIEVLAVSAFYETAAVGRAGQPAYVNAVARLETSLSPEALLRRLKAIERGAGRRGGSPWGPRTLDIDILDYKGLIRNWSNGRPGYASPGRKPLILPHPWIEQRPFVLGPLRDIVPNWRHPVTKKKVQRLWSAALRRGEGQVMRQLDGGFSLPARPELHK